VITSRLCIIGAFLAIAASAPARAALVQNGNFAANGGVGSSDFTGWTDSDGSIQVDSTFAAPGDTFDAAFTGTGTLSQSIVTSAGDSYTLSFLLFDESGFVGDSFTVGFGAFSTTITGDTAAAYTAESFLVPGVDIIGSLTTLSFQGFNLSSDWNLDDVSVTPVTASIPEPGSAALVLAALTIGTVLTGRPRRARV
jgi:hypothetical protein